MQTALCSHRPTLGDEAPLSHHSKPGLTLKIPDGNPGPDGSCHIQGGGKTFIGAGVYHPSSGNSNLVVTNGAGMINNTGRAELAAIAATITHDHIHITAELLIKNTISTLKRPPAFSVHTVSKQIVLSIFSQDVNIQSSQV